MGSKFVGRGKWLLIVGKKKRDADLSPSLPSTGERGDQTRFRFLTVINAKHWSAGTVARLFCN
jgi:hypothetical protein